MALLTVVFGIIAVIFFFVSFALDESGSTQEPLYTINAIVVLAFYYLLLLLEAFNLKLPEWAMYASVIAGIVIDVIAVEVLIVFYRRYRAKKLA
jgi:hypothetical protein